MYRTLDANQIVKTLQNLKERIDGRFPGSGLSKVCGELLELTRETEARIAEIERPNMVLRVGLATVLVLGILLLWKIGAIIRFKVEDENLSGILQGIDSGFNILLLMGAGMLFLSTLEARWKRDEVMEHLHELRSIAHVIDMHQLPKDPSSDRPATVAVAGQTGQRPLNAFELTRYLDYCSEMLSITAKVAALYAQSTKDAIVVDATSDISQITTNLSAKIWQKITLVQAREGRNAPAAPPAPTANSAPPSAPNAS